MQTQMGVSFIVCPDFWVNLFKIARLQSTTSALLNFGENSVRSFKLSVFSYDWIVATISGHNPVRECTGYAHCASEYP